MKEVPNSLRTWFVIHFIADMLFGIPSLNLSSLYLAGAPLTLYPPAWSARR